MGIMYRRRAQQRVNELKGLQQMIELMAGQIRFERDTLPQVCMKISGYLDGDYGKMLFRIYQIMEENPGIEFSKIYREEMMSTIRSFPLKAQEKSFALALFDGNGFEDRQMQIDMLQNRYRMIQHMIQDAEEAQGKIGRIAVGMGILTGLFIVIVLI